MTLAEVSKFSYTKELLLPQARVLVDGLLFTTEGYARAKTILKIKYVKISEVVNAHVQALVNLHTIIGTNPNRIYEFYENLITLGTLGKLKEINGYVRSHKETEDYHRHHLLLLPSSLASPSTASPDPDPDQLW